MPLFVKGMLKGTRMSMLNVTLPDGTVKEVAAGTTPLDVAKSIGEALHDKPSPHTLAKLWLMRRLPLSLTPICVW